MRQGEGRQDIRIVCHCTMRRECGSQKSEKPAGRPGARFFDQEKRLPEGQAEGGQAEDRIRRACDGVGTFLGVFFEYLVFEYIVFEYIAQGTEEEAMDKSVDLCVKGKATEFAARRRSIKEHDIRFRWFLRCSVRRNRMSCMSCMKSKRSGKNIPEKGFGRPVEIDLIGRYFSFDSGFCPAGFGILQQDGWIIPHNAAYKNDFAKVESPDVPMRFGQANPSDSPWKGSASCGTHRDGRRKLGVSNAKSCRIFEIDSKCRRGQSK